MSCDIQHEQQMRPVYTVRDERISARSAMGPPAVQAWPPSGFGRRRGSHADGAVTSMTSSRSTEVISSRGRSRPGDGRSGAAGGDTAVDGGGQRRHGGQLQIKGSGAVAPVLALDAGLGVRAGRQRACKACYHQHEEVATRELNPKGYVVKRSPSWMNAISRSRTRS